MEWVGWGGMEWYGPEWDGIVGAGGGDGELSAEGNWSGMVQEGMGVCVGVRMGLGPARGVGLGMGRGWWGDGLEMWGRDWKRNWELGRGDGEGNGR